MPQYTVWTMSTAEKAVEASTPQEAAARYHETIGQMPEEWDGTLYVRDAREEEWTYRRRKAA